MAVYKVPQDVEAEDKLIGPFSFRQFIYLIIVALAITLAWGLSQLLIPLAIIPIPIIILFSALALPLRKDQPMETYMAAMVSFFLKPHLRLWDPDGIDSLIEITVPRVAEVQRTKDISQNEAQRRFSYLAEIADSQGWSVRGAGVQAPNSAMNSDVYYEAQQVQDVMDNNNITAMSFNQKLGQSDALRHQNAVNMMSGKINPNTVNYFGNAAPSEPGAAAEPITNENLAYNPYPDEIHQTVVQPISTALTRPTISPAVPASKPTITTSEKPLAAGIINLANNTDLSIETIAREANRIHDKQELSEEVVISLR
jgi:hypothetical protein